MGVLLFMAVLRTEDLKRLFSVALTLKAAFPAHRRYTFWAALALHLQRPKEITIDDGPSKEDKLAFQMLLKEYERSLFQTTEELNLFLLVACANGEYGKALEVFLALEHLIQGSYDLASTKVDLLVKTERWQEAFDYTAGLLEAKGIYDWSLWRACSTSLSHLPSDSTADQVSAILKGENTDNRSLLLARVDAAFSGYAFEGFSKEQLLLRYAEQSPRKETCLPDLMFMFDKFTGEERRAFAGLVDGKFAHDGQEDLIFWAQLHRCVQHKLGQWSATCVSDLKEKVAQIDPDVEEDKAKRFFLLGLLDMDLYLITADYDHLVRAIAWMSQALQVSPGDFITRLVCTILYLASGSVFSALETFKRLDIKQIQIDSLAYILSDHLLNLGNLGDAEFFFHEAFFLYDDNRSQTMSAISDICLKQAYSRLPEFYELFTRLEHSIQSIATIMETIRTELLYKPVEGLLEYLMGIKKDELMLTAADVGKIADNRDMDIIAFLDHSGNLATNLFPTLPKFDKTALWCISALALLLKALIAQDQATLTELRESYAFPEAFHSGPNERPAFVLGLLEIFANGPITDPDAVLSKMRELISDVKISPMGYNAIASVEWRIERLRWATLAFHMAAHGIKQQKLRKALLRSLRPALDLLQAEYTACEGMITSFAYGPILIGSATDEVKQAEDLVISNLRRSMENFKALLALSQPVLKALIAQ